MRKMLVVLLAAAVLAGCAQSPTTVPPQTSAVPAAQPWGPAQAALRSAQADVVKGGLRTLQPRVAELERALAGSGAAYAAAPPDGSSGFVLADGAAETLVALAAAANAMRGEGKVVAVADPYPSIAFLLGSYYNEVGRSADALRVLEAGLALPGGLTGQGLGTTRPHLASERGAALLKMKRWPEALTAYDSGLALPGLEVRDKARMLRGRGFALIELKRLDEAESTFRDSLKAEPGNALAFNELRYIAQLRRGGQAAPAQLVLPNQPAGGAR